MLPDDIREAQFRQLAHLLTHAFGKIEHWAIKLRRAGFQPGRKITPDQFAAVPILTRKDVQRLNNALMSPDVPRGHGRVSKAQTSGSTGTPISFCTTDLTQHFWRALTLREHLWQQRDFSGSLASIRSNVERSQASNWGTATSGVVETGPAYALNIREDIGVQLNWLMEMNPDYLLTHPSNLKALARRAEETGISWPNLRQLRTFGEVLPDSTRELCKRVWEVDIADVYSSEEAGYIALQCELGAYHIQSENLLVEIVDDDGEPAKPGTIGRVLITTLHNFAMPLLRYEIGDYAEFDGPCACGRGLPVIRRIMGRSRNMLRLPDGTEHWPSFPEDRWAGIAPIRQLQVVQKRLDRIVLKIDSERPLERNEKLNLIRVFQTILCFPHEIDIEEVASIPRTRNSKYEDFISELS